MSDAPVTGERPRRGYGLWAAVAIAGLLAGTVLYLHRDGNNNSSATAPSVESALLAGLAKGEVAAFSVRPQPVNIPVVTFKDAEGKDHGLPDWHGKVVLLNLWATWCAPCRREMPALDALKSEIGGKDFDVVALATDRGGIGKPQKFWSETGIKSLTLYLDSSDAQHQLGVIGMPTTLLIGRDGREVGRMVGPAEWASPDAKALIESALKLN